MMSKNAGTFSRNLTTGVEGRCDLSSVNNTFRNNLKNTSSISMDDGNNLFYVINGDIYSHPIERNS